MSEIDEGRIETLVGLLLDKSESEIQSAFEKLGIPPKEQEEIRKRLRLRKPPPQGFTPEELRQHPHFRELVSFARRGEVIFFIGAGMSVDAGMPSTGQLWDALRAEAKLFGLETIPPEFPRAALEIERVIGRHKLVQILKEEFDKALNVELPPYQRAAYRLLSKLPPEITRIMITTNWDDLLKRAFESTKRKPAEITRDVLLPQVPLADPAILKLHGSFEDPEGMVITDMDYARVSSLIHERTAGTLYGYVAALLAQYSFVFIGYRKADPDFRLLEDFVKISTGKRKHFFVAPLSREEEEAVSLWADVKTVPATATNFLLALFRELDEFANRQYELDLIFKPSSPPIVEFYGPYGSGKTALLDAAERRAQVKGWTPRQIVRVNWDREKNGTLRETIDSDQKMLQVLNEAFDPRTPFKRLEDICENLVDKRGVFLLFDGLQNVKARNLIRFISEIIAPVIREMNEQRKPSKLLLAGRFPLKDVPYMLRKEMKSIALSPFSEDDVREMAYNFLLTTDPDSQERFEPELIADILEVSGGHALFIKLILEELLSEKRRYKGQIRLPRRLTEKEKRDFTLQFNEELDRHIQWPSQTIKEIYEDSLCVFRRLNRDLLKALEPPVEDPLPDLQRAYIFSPEGFYNDPVIRRIKTARLRFEAPEKFIKAQERAQSLFAEGMKRLVHPQQLDYIIEWLFHSVQILLVKIPDEPKKRYDELAEMVEKEVHYRAYIEQVWGDVGAEIEKRIVEQDKELQTLLEKCVEQDGAAAILGTLSKKEVLDAGQI